MRVAVCVMVMAWIGVARAESNWFDPKKGCGAVGEYAKTGRAAGLPGCTGKLPKDAPQAEVQLKELKELVVEAEEALDDGKVDKIDALVDKAEAVLKKAPPTHPELPDRWEQAERAYREHLGRLRSGRRLYPHREQIRTAYAAAMAADRDKNHAAVDGGPAEAVKAAAACSDALAVVAREKIDGATPIELEKKTTRPVEELVADCARVRKDAEAKAREQDKAKKAAAKKAKKRKKR